MRRLPVSSETAAEALRVAVGQTLASQRVTLCLIEDGVWVAGPLNPNVVGAPDIAKHLEAMIALGHRVVVEEEAARARGLERLAAGVEVKPRGECFDLLTRTDTVISY